MLLWFDVGRGFAPGHISTDLQETKQGGFLMAEMPSILGAVISEQGHLGVFPRSIESKKLVPTSPIPNGRPLPKHVSFAGGDSLIKSHRT